jgi:hypothetical protein
MVIIIITTKRYPRFPKKTAHGRERRANDKEETN